VQILSRYFARIWDSVGVGEIFPLDAAFREELLYGFDEFVDESVIRFAAHARSAQTEIEWILKQSGIVRSNVDRDRETDFRGHACASGIEGELSDWNTHAADAEIAKTENPFAIGDDDEPHVLLWPIGKQLLDAAPGQNRHVNSAGGMEDMIDPLGGLANGRCRQAA